MKRQQLIVLSAVLLMAAACSKRGAPPSKAEAGKDYRQMLAHARSRQAVQVNLQTVQTALQKFQVDLARFPTNLGELVRLNYLKEIPPLPDDMDYSYDPGLGGIQLVRIQQGAAPAPPDK